MRPGRVNVFLAVFLGSGAVLAQSESVAEALFRTARGEMKAGKYAEACPKLAESQRLDPSPGTILNLAICEERRGRIATAWVKFKELLDTTRPEDPRARLAREHIAALGPSIPHLRIRLEVQPGQTLVVLLDGAKLGPASLDVPLPIDPGPHRVEVSDERGRKSEQSVDVRLGEQAELTLTPPGGDAPVTARADRHTLPEPERALAVRRAPASPKTGESLAVRERSSTSALEIAGLMGGGAGIVTLGAAVVFALQAKALDEESREDGHCDDVDCDSIGMPLRKEALAKGDVASLLAMTGGVFVAGGLTLYLVGRGQRDSKVGRMGASITSRGRNDAFVKVHVAF